ncbi:MAG: peptidase U32 family protein [Spirochaetota bacterium]
MRECELLSPAKDADTGIRAINSGADAVYIGVEGFSARSRAGNSVQKIERLVRYAHIYHARVYGAFNVILEDRDLDTARSLSRQLYEAGVDALIIQDTAFLRMDMPPIALHASTQTASHDIHRFTFFSRAGFTRIILPRELTLAQIREYNTVSGCETECFVHGAICVSYSGNCYLSAHAGGRSANRGECAQPCRKEYTVSDSSGRVIASGEQVLSLPDLCRIRRLKDLAEAGVTSFKIEGRLKDESYVSNVTAAYRRALDTVIDGGGYRRPSSGVFIIPFVPDVEKSFNRGFTEYGTAPDTKKERYTASSWTGKKTGVVRRCTNERCDYTGDTLANGDGICYFIDGKLHGTRALVQGGTLKLPKPLPPDGCAIYRNRDLAFERSVTRTQPVRVIPCRIQIDDRNGVSVFTVSDIDGYQSSVRKEKGSAILNRESYRDAVYRSLSKSGGTPFRIEEVSGLPGSFHTVATLNAVRRELLETITGIRRDSMPRVFRRKECALNIYPYTSADYRANVTNSHAQAFYREHGVETISPGYELLTEHEQDSTELMRSVYCVIHAWGLCGKEKALLLRDNAGNTLTAQCDGARCEMGIRSATKSGASCILR